MPSHFLKMSSMYCMNAHSWKRRILQPKLKLSMLKTGGPAFKIRKVPLNILTDFPIGQAFLNSYISSRNSLLCKYVKKKNVTPRFL